MNSELATRFDDKTILLEASSNETFINELDEQYGKTTFGNPNAIDKEVLYWTGYVYRYWCYIYQISSEILVKYVRPNILFQKYKSYHSQDTEYAIDCIIEEEHIVFPSKKTLEEVLDEYFREKNLKKDNQLDSK